MAQWEETNQKVLGLERERYINLTLFSVCAPPFFASVSASFGPKHPFLPRQQTAHVSVPISGPTGGKEEEKPSGFTGRSARLQRTRSRLSRRIHPKWRWIRERSLPVSTSVSTATYYLRPLPDGLEPNQPRLQGNLLCSKDWLQLQEIARSEWAILPIQEVAAHPWCTVCERLRSRNRPEARCALSARAGWVPWNRCADKVDGPCSGHTDSICDSGPECWEWDLDVAGGNCPSVPEPPLPLRATVPFQPRFLLQEFIRALYPFQPRWFLHGSHLTECDWLSQECGENRKRRLRSRRCQLLTAERQAMKSSQRAKHQKSVHISGNHFAARNMDPLFARSISAQ